MALGVALAMARNWQAAVAELTEAVACAGHSVEHRERAEQALAAVVKARDVTEPSEPPTVPDPDEAATRRRSWAAGGRRRAPAGRRRHARVAGVAGELARSRAGRGRQHHVRLRPVPPAATPAGGAEPRGGAWATAREPGRRDAAVRRRDPRLRRRRQARRRALRRRAGPGRGRRGVDPGHARGRRLRPPPAARELGRRDRPARRRPRRRGRLPAIRRDRRAGGQAGADTRSPACRDLRARGDDAPAHPREEDQPAGAQPGVRRPRAAGRPRPRPRPGRGRRAHGGASARGRPPPDRARQGGRHRT